MTLYDKRRSGILYEGAGEETVRYVYPEKDVKEAVKRSTELDETFMAKTVGLIWGLGMNSDFPMKEFNTKFACMFIDFERDKKEIFGEGLYVEQSSTILEDSHPLGIHSPQTKTGVAEGTSEVEKSIGLDKPVDNIQNSEDKK